MHSNAQRLCGSTISARDAHAFTTTKHSALHCYSVFIDPVIKRPPADPATLLLYYLLYLQLGSLFKKIYRNNFLSP
ncbi:hypothetical protein GN956_G10970 [Arapaima gigas]